MFTRRESAHLPPFKLGWLPVPDNVRGVSSVAEKLLWLAHEVGREDRNLVILNEGSVSAKLDADRILVKSTGAALGKLGPKQIVGCSIERMSKILELSFLNTSELEAEMNRSIDLEVTGKIWTDLEVKRQPTLDPAVVTQETLGELEIIDPKPSAEAVFHAWVLSMDEIAFVAHAHPVAINQILCSPQAEPFATQRMFPDQVYRCGATSVYVPYADPGVPLAREIRGKVLLGQRRAFGSFPKLILLQNHGVIAMGKTEEDVLATLLMAEKAAQVFIGSAILGGPVFMHQHQVQRLDPKADDGSRHRSLHRTS